MARIEKRLLDPSRPRTLPKEGFSWIDRRFLREDFATRLPAPQLLLYCFLCSVADAQGLSFYSDARVVSLLKISPCALVRSRHGLIQEGLILFEYPLYQVLPLPARPWTYAATRSS